MKSRRFSANIRPMRIAVLSLILLFSICLTGCELSSISKDNSHTTPPANHETEGKTDLNNNDVQNNGGSKPTPPIQVVYYNALTGLETTSELAALRPVAICLENTAYSLPQYGLSGAQIVIEAPTADGNTKLMLLTTDYRYMTTIGAITSTRPYLASLGNYFGAIQCFNGTDGTISEDDLGSYDVIDAQDPKLNGIYYKDESRFDKDDLMTNGILIDSGVRRAELNAEKVNTMLPYQFVSGDQPVAPTDTRAQEVSIRYTNDANAVFTYDSESGLYMRSQFGSVTLDGTTNNAVGFQNLIILYASSSTYESKDNKTLDFILKDGGKGSYISCGMSTSFSWFVDEAGALQFVDANGNPLEINRGTSYIGVMPVGQESNVYIH